MSGRRRLGGLLDRRFLVGLAVLAAACLAFGALGHVASGVEGAETLVASYGLVSTYLVATFVFVPVYVACVPGAFRPAESAVWVTRSGRARALGRCLRALVARAASFSAVVTGVGLAVAALRGPAPWDLTAWALFGSSTFLLQALFFLAIGLLMFAVRLLTGSGAYAALAAVAYGALDFVLSMTQASSNPLLWTGWFLTVVNEADGMTMELAGCLRLAAGCAVLAAVCVWSMHDRDFLPEGGGAHEL